MRRKDCCRSYPSCPNFIKGNSNQIIFRYTASLLAAAPRRTFETNWKSILRGPNRRAGETDLLATKRVEIVKYITLKRVGKIHIWQEIQLASRLGVDFLRKRTQPSFTFPYGLPDSWALSTMKCVRYWILASCPPAKIDGSSIEYWFASVPCFEFINCYVHVSYEDIDRPSS